MNGNFRVCSNHKSPISQRRKDHVKRVITRLTTLKDHKSAMEGSHAPPWQSGLHYRHSILAPVDRTSASAWLHKHPWITCKQ